MWVMFGGMYFCDGRGVLWLWGVELGMFMENLINFFVWFWSLMGLLLFCCELCVDWFFVELIYVCLRFLSGLFWDEILRCRDFWVYDDYGGVVIFCCGYFYLRLFFGWFWKGCYCDLGLRDYVGICNWLSLGICLGLIELMMDFGN